MPCTGRHTWDNKAAGFTVSSRCLHVTTGGPYAVWRMHASCRFKKSYRPHAKTIPFRQRQRTVCVANEIRETNSW